MNGKTKYSSTHPTQVESGLKDEVEFDKNQEIYIYVDCQVFFNLIRKNQKIFQNGERRIVRARSRREDVDDYDDAEDAPVFTHQ